MTMEKEIKLFRNFMEFATDEMVYNALCFLNVAGWLEGYYDSSMLSDDKLVVSDDKLVECAIEYSKTNNTSVSNFIRRFNNP